MKKIFSLFVILIFLCSCQNTHTHYFTETEIDATCIESGYTLFECECGYSYKDKIINAKGHTYINRVCNICGDIYTGPSQGLSYSLNDDQLSYTLNGIGSCTDVNIVIPNEYNGLPVIRISDNAFLNNSNIKSIDICNNIVDVGENVLKGCMSLEELTIPYIYNGYVGYLFGATSSSYNNSAVPKSLKKINISLEVKIQKNAFSNCSNLEKISFGDNLEEIGSTCFYNCQNLKELTISNKLTRIKDRAFSNCEKLEIVNINGHYESWFNIVFESIESNPMLYASTLNYFDDEYKELNNIEVPKHITSINEYQLYGIDCATKLIVHENVEYISESAIVSMLNLNNIEVNPANKYYASSNGVLYTKDFSKLLMYPCSKDDIIYTVSEYTIEINHYAFYNNQFVEEIILPDSLTTIGKYCFAKAVKLKKIILPEGISILAEGSFNYCINLYEIYLPNNLSEIQSYVFEYCTSLERIFIPKNVQIIQAYAFRNCEKLSIYCEMGSKPNGWVSSYWNVYPSCPVYWNQSR